MMKQDTQSAGKISRTKVTMTQCDRGQRTPTGVTGERFGGFCVVSTTGVTGERFGGFCVISTAPILQRSH